MSNLNVRTESKPRINTVGNVIGVILCIAATVVVVSALAWVVVAIWRGILGA